MRGEVSRRREGVGGAVQTTGKKSAVRFDEQASSAAKAKLFGSIELKLSCSFIPTTPTTTSLPPHQATKRIRTKREEESIVGTEHRHRHRHQRQEQRPHHQQQQHLCRCRSSPRNHGTPRHRGTRGGDRRRGPPCSSPEA